MYDIFLLLKTGPNAWKWKHVQTSLTDKLNIVIGANAIRENLLHALHTNQFTNFAMDLRTLSGSCKLFNKLLGDKYCQVR